MRNGGGRVMGSPAFPLLLRHTDHFSRVREREESGRPVKVFVASQSRLCCELIADSLSRAGLRVVGTASSPDETVAGVRKLFPEIVLVDFPIPHGPGCVESVNTGSPVTLVLAFNVPEIEDAIIAWAESGVTACLTERATIGELFMMLEGAARGESTCRPMVAAALFHRVAALAPRTEAERRGLTARETEILALLADGLSNKEIAKRLTLQVPTVKTHVHHILAKLRVRSRFQAAVRARQGGTATM